MINRDMPSFYVVFRSKQQISFLVGLNGNAKQRRKMFRAFKRSPTHKGFEISLIKETKQ